MVWGEADLPCSVVSLGCLGLLNEKEMDQPSCAYGTG